MVVATGSGIGPVAPVLLEKKLPIRLLWTSPDVRKTFGDDLVDSILAAEPGAVIYGMSPSSGSCCHQTPNTLGRHKKKWQT